LADGRREGQLDLDQGQELDNKIIDVQERQVDVELLEQDDGNGQQDTH